MKLGLAFTTLEGALHGRTPCAGYFSHPSSMCALPSATWNRQRIRTADVMKKGRSLVIDPEMLTPEQAAELLHRQEALQAEVHTVLAELHLMEVLTSIGQVRRVGSSVLGVMVWRDIDLNVSAAGVSIDLILETMRPVFAHPNVKRIRYLKEVGHFNPTGEQVETTS